MVLEDIRFGRPGPWCSVRGHGPAAGSTEDRLRAWATFAGIRAAGDLPGAECRFRRLDVLGDSLVVFELVIAPAGTEPP